ncbi:hypothetical protein [Lysinibacillus sp. 54212]|uniref:hypothetical protein n=1 Tax=Lysinibacillus sp. 54212 TaxID=3119829 RepID=UPI002FC9612F
MTNQSQYLFEFKIEVEEKGNQSHFKVSYVGEQRLLKKMIELAKNEGAQIVYKEASAFKKFLYRQPYQFAIADRLANKSGYPHWSLDGILTGKNIIILENNKVGKGTPKSLVEELSAYAGQVASRQGNLFKS